MRLTELDEIEYKKKWRLEGMGRQQERGMSETKKRKQELDTVKMSRG